jgi:hypothetical protein
MAEFPRRRFLLACAVPFACVFGATLLRSNAMFALDGMINHTAVDNKMTYDSLVLNKTVTAGNTTSSDTCIAVRRNLL